MPVFHVGDVIRKLRKERGLTQKQLAKLAGMRPNTLGDLESGKKNFEQETLEDAARALNVTVRQLYQALALEEGRITPDEVGDGHANGDHRELCRKLGDLLARGHHEDPGLDLATGIRVNINAMWNDLRRRGGGEHAADAKGKALSKKR